MNTVVFEKSLVEDEQRVDIFSRLLHSRVLFVNDFVEDRSAADIVASLLLLDKDPEHKITIIINSQGGDIRCVFMIFDTIKMLQSPVETLCIGSAMGESVLLLAAGTPGMRLITKNADVGVSQLFHFASGHSDLTDVKISHEKIKRDNEQFLKELSKASGKKIALLRKDTERQIFLTPEQAVKYGLADKVVS